MREKIKFRIVKKQGGCQYSGKPFYVVKYKRNLPFYKYITSYVDAINGCGTEPKTYTTIEEAKQGIEEKAKFLKLYNTPKSSSVLQEIEL